MKTQNLGTAALIGLLTACTASTLPPNAQIDSNVPSDVSSPAPGAVAENWPERPSEEAPRATRTGAGTSASGKPVEFKIDQDRSFAPVLPEGIEGYAVPAIVSEPVARYVGASEGAATAESLGLVLTDPPTPKLRMAPKSVPFTARVLGPLPIGTGGRDSPGIGISPPEPPSPAAPPFTTVFGSLGFDDNVPNTGGSVFIPPDAIGAAGPDHVVSVVNTSIQFHTKAGTPLLDSVAGGPVTGISLASFFAPLAPLTQTFDPKVIFDQHAARFVVVTLEQTDALIDGMPPGDTSRILVAVSDDSDPNGTWFFTSIPSAVATTTACAFASWADYPGFAVDEEAVYISANLFGFFSFGAPFCGTRLWVIDKLVGAGGGFYGGGTATVSLFDPYPQVMPTCLTSAPFCATTQPAHVFGLPSAGAPNVGTWLSVFSGIGLVGGDEALQIMRFDDPVGPGTPTFIGPIFVSMGNIDDLSGPLPDAPQFDVPLDGAPSPPLAIETNDRRTLQSVWRDNSLYVTTTIDPEAGDPNDGDATAHWVHMDTTTLVGAPPPIPLVDQGDIGGEDIPDISGSDSKHTFFPSIAVNDSGDIAIGFSASGATIHPGSYYTTHLPGDLAGSNTGSTVLSAGLDEYVRTFDDAAFPPCASPPADNRWGDYSGASVDPFDECFWIFNQHADLRGSGTGGGCNGAPATEDGRWATSFGYVCESCPTNLVLPSKTVSGIESEEARDSLTASTVTVEGPAGDLTLTSDKVTLLDGFTVETGGELMIVNGPCS